MVDEYAIFVYENGIPTGEGIDITGFKRYANETSAKAAIKKAGLHLMTVDYPVRDGAAVQKRGVEPVVICADADDARYVRYEKGFNAIVDTSRAVMEG